MRWLGATVAVLVVAAVGAALWWSLSGDGGTTEAATADGDAGVTQRPLVHLEAGDQAWSADAGVRTLRGRVVHGEAFTPVPGARVRVVRDEGSLLERGTCGECGVRLVECSEPATIAAAVEALRAATGARRVLAEGLTDGEGLFSLPELPGVPLRVLVTHEGESGGGTWPDEEPEGDEPHHVPIGPPTPRGVTVTEVVSTAMDLQEAPVAGARVTVVNLDTGDWLETTTNAEGRAQALMGDGNVWIAAQAPGFGAAAGFWSEDFALVLQRERALIVHTQSGGQPVEATVRLVGAHPHVMRSVAGEARFALFGEIEGLTAEVRDLVARVGRVPFAEAGDTHVTVELRRRGRLLVAVLDELGQPVEGADVSASQGDVSASGVSGADGALVELGPLPEGPMVLAVTAPGLRASERTVDVKAGDTQVDVVLHRLVPIAGSVVDGDGRPLGGVQVRATAPNGALVFVQTGETEADGTFHLEVEEPGRWLLEASGPMGRARREAEAPSANVVLTLEPRASVEVQLVDEAGAPLEGMVSMDRQEGGGAVSLSIPPEGRLRWAGLEPGPWKLTAMADGFLSGQAQATLVDGRTTVVTVRLMRGVQVTGLVVDHRGVPQAQVLVTCSPCGSSSLTEDDGRFVLEEVPRGVEVEVAARTTDAANRALATARVQAPVAGVTLTIEEARRVRGRVVDAVTGKPVASFFVADNSFENPEGTFEVATRSRQIALSALAYETLERPAPEDGELGTVPLVPIAAVDGVVLLPSGQPAAGATVTGDSMAETVTGQDGRFLLRVVGEGPPSRVTAQLGAWSVSAPCKPGDHLTLRLSEPLRVRGRVLGLDGRGAGVVVQISEVGGMASVRRDTLPDGTFEVALGPGRYGFTTRTVMGVSVVDVERDGQEVVLGATPSACEVRVEADRPLEAAWLIPSGLAPGALHADFLPPPGTVVLTPLEGERSVVGLAPTCGEWDVAAVAEGEVGKVHVTLRGGAGPQAVAVVIPPPAP